MSTSSNARDAVLADTAKERRTQAVAAVDRALDLLPHEDPETSHAEDARRWIQVYRELIGVKDALLKRLEEELPRLVDSARLEMTHTDETILRHQRDHYQARLDFWQQRHWELHRLDLDPLARIIRHGDKEVDLTRREVELLACLMERPGNFLSAEQIIRLAWGDGALHNEEVRTYIVRLRRKLAQVGAPTRIVNRARKGYAIEHGQ
ncbi:MAG: winged helix-turn-helix domain-containing protein [Candidatus Dormibacteria bacterium]